MRMPRTILGASVTFGIAYSVLSWFLVQLANRPGVGAFVPLRIETQQFAILAGLVVVAAITASSIPVRATTWMVRQSPILAAVLLTLVHGYVQLAALMIFANENLIAKFSPLMLLMPVAAAVWTGLLTCPLMLAMTVFGAGVFCRIRDRLENV